MGYIGSAGRLPENNSTYYSAVIEAAILYKLCFDDSIEISRMLALPLSWFGWLWFDDIPHFLPLFHEPPHGASSLNFTS